MRRREARWWSPVSFWLLHFRFGFWLRLGLSLLRCRLLGCLRCLLLGCLRCLLLGCLRLRCLLRCPLRLTSLSPRTLEKMLEQLGVLHGHAALGTLCPELPCLCLRGPLSPLSRRGSALWLLLVV